MKVCPKCNANVEDHAAFCGTCGTSVGAQPIYQPSVKGRLHCPHCRGTRLTAVAETSSGTTNTVHTPFGNGAVSTGRTKYDNRHYWMCGDCGHKFRNLEDLQDEIVRTKKKQKMDIIGSILVALGLLLCLMIPKELLLIFAFPTLLFAGLLIFGVLSVVSGKKKMQNLSEELAYLEVKCFD